MKRQFFHLEEDKVEEVRKVCKAGEYRVLNQASIPSVIPKNLKAKCPEAVVLASTCDTGVVYCINLRRIDIKDKAIDDMPYALVAAPNNAASSCLLHHADYEGRTTYPDNEFWQMVNASGIEEYVQLPESPPNRHGPLSELQGSSHEKGFLKAKVVIVQHDKNLKRENRA
ncbi:MAG: hypothetical protein KKE91_03180 [Candidatus Omnitrophica bacterium]|nr:hypothetical protein [Candidatus Omnitrophota bacterium]